MLRIFVYLVVVALIAFGITMLTRLEGLMLLQIGTPATGGMEFSTHVGLFFGLLIILTIIVTVFTLLVSGLIRLPKSLQRRQNEQRRARGMMALTRGFEAVVAGDADDAQRYARSANKNLVEPGVTRLLTAQAAQLAGDDSTAQECFAAMLDAPETEFIGLRGLYLQAKAAGDTKEARGYADRAFRLRPSAEWAYRSVFGLNVDRGAWGDAREALLLAQQHSIENVDVAKRKEAALLTAQAYAAEAAGDAETAMRDAELALKRAPGFAPAVVLAAKLEAAAGRRSKGARLLDEAWAVAPHPAIAKTMSDLFEKETPARRAARLKRLAKQAPNADESILLVAEQDIALEDYDTARAALEPLLLRKPRARTFTAMAKAIEGLYGRDVAQPWLDRAAAAPLDPVPGADGVFHFTTDGWQRLIREFAEHGRLAPPPLEEIQTALTADEVRLLAAPPPAPEPEVDASEEAAADGQEEADVAEATDVAAADDTPATDTIDTTSADQDESTSDASADKDAVNDKATAAS